MILHSLVLKMLQNLTIHKNGLRIQNQMKLVKKLFVNYFNVLSELNEEDFKRKKLNIQSGDELPPGIVQLAKVYVAKKT
jgi:hypothetical protein